MNARSKKKRSSAPPEAPASSQKKKPTRHRIAHQITLSPEATKILEKWVARMGEGTKSIHVDMAIRYADRCKVFEGDLIDGMLVPPHARAATLDGAPAQPVASLEEAVIKHLPNLITRLATEAFANSDKKPEG